ncbi:histidine kinase [Cohnella sp. GCM10020058]|uniref:histidine kinase n=1 Tax=Cohnella sp. GCM10020058 TaxID=3317330 RepID=UPI003627BF33
MAVKRRFFSIQSKLLALLCALITVPFLFSGYITYYKYSSNVERDAAAYSEQIAEQVSINLERYIKEMERITLSLYYDESVLGILTKHAGPLRQDNYLASNELSSMSQLMSSLIYEQGEVEGIFVFAPDGSLFSNLQETARIHWTVDGNGWMTDAISMDGGLAILPPSPGGYYLDKPREVVTLARLIKNPVTGVPLGFVKVDLTSAGFERILSPVQVTPNSRLFIFNADGDRIYPFKAEADGGGIRPDPAGASGKLVSERFTDYGGLRIVGVIPKEDVLADARRLTSFTLWISLGALLVAYLASIYTARRLVRPIRALHAKMKRVQNGELGERAPVTSSDEIGLLTTGFNIMVSRLEVMIKENYELTLREKEAQLSALQSQINPHFLYNTLESISMSARREGASGWPDAIASLGKLLRYTVDKQERLVPLGEELAFVDNYLNIQSFRLESRLAVDVQVDLSHESALVPKLILQPLVENAIEHGMSAGP